MNFTNLEPPADVYSMGATLYFVLCGQCPVSLNEDAPNEEQLRIVITGERIPIRDRMPDIPVRLAGVVDKACCKDDAARFRTAASFQAALRNAI